MNKKLQEQMIILIKKRLAEGWTVTVSDKGIITIKPKGLNND